MMVLIFFNKYKKLNDFTLQILLFLSLIFFRKIVF